MQLAGEYKFTNLNSEEPQDPFYPAMEKCITPTSITFSYESQVKLLDERKRKDRQREPS